MKQIGDAINWIVDTMNYNHDEVNEINDVMNKIVMQWMNLMVQ